MPKNSLRSSLVCGIIFLFFGLCITSSINGIINNNSLKVTVTNYSLNDYILGYWKFDECKGPTAYDSSGHDFHGLINGATWISYGSGCALYFDGENDFVALDDHSENLGLNKTDDMIFSGYFNSTSTNEGLIFSMSDSWNKENPELSIKLCSNGSISFKVWTLYCGIECYSDSGHNDGKPHFFQIYFHGSTAKPTIEIYIDGHDENSVTEWLCEISADEFRRAKIGRRAVNNSIAFNGVIDRFKIIKYPGGNIPPNPPNISGPGVGSPGEELTYTFVSHDLEKDDVWYKIDWGNGDITNWFGPEKSGEEITERYTYSEEGIYYIKAQAADYWNEGLWTNPPFKVIIGNVPPNTPTIRGRVNGETGVEYQYTFNTTDPNGDDINYFIDWGDTNTEWTGNYPSGIDVKANHSWSERGNYTIKAKAIDGDGAESEWGFLEVTMPKNMAYKFNIFKWLWKVLFYAFPVINYLLR
jgi:hypothetical protein